VYKAVSKEDFRSSTDFTEGRNITPPELRADQRNALNQACDMALVETINILQVKIIVCIGKFIKS
jgi:hypothetical protein